MLRNKTLDNFKILLSFLVVAVHLPLFLGLGQGLSYNAGWLISNGLARIAVPCFLIINGYFLNLSNPEKFWKTIGRLLIMYLIWMAVYSPFYYRLIIGNVKYFLQLLLFGYHHLWYMMSLLLSAILLFFINKLGVSKKIIAGLLIALFLMGYAIQTVAVSKSLASNFIVTYRNFLFFGFPFLTIGYLIKNISEPTRAKLIKFAPVIIIVGTLLLLLESYLSLKQHLGVNLYISLLILCPAIMILVFKAEWQKSTRFKADVANAIYFSHAGVILCTQYYLPHVANIYIYPLVLLITLAVSCIIYFINIKAKILL